MIINISKDVIIPVIIPQLQLLNAHMLQLGLEEQLYIYGEQVGLEIARLAGEKMGKTSMTFGELVEWTPFIVKHLTVGLSRAEVVHVDSDRGEYVIRVHNSPYAMVPGGKKLRRKRPACYLLAGIFAGGATSILKKRYRAEETKCISKGDKYCEFKVFPE